MNRFPIAAFLTLPLRLVCKQSLPVAAARERSSAAKALEDAAAALEGSAQWPTLGTILM